MTLPQNQAYHVFEDEDLDCDLALKKSKGFWDIQTNDGKPIWLDTGKVKLDRIDVYKDKKMGFAFTVSNPKVCDKIVKIETGVRTWAAERLTGQVHSNVMLTRRTIETLLGKTTINPNEEMKCGFDTTKGHFSDGTNSIGAVTSCDTVSALAGRSAYLTIEPAFLWFLNEPDKEKRMGVKWYIRMIRLDEDYDSINETSDTWSL